MMTPKARTEKLLTAMKAIAAGQYTQHGKPMSGEEARQTARTVLVELKEDWPSQVPRRAFYKVEKVDGEAKLMPMGDGQ